MLNITIPFLTMSIFFFVIALVSGIFNYKRRFKLDYHLRSHFPFELNYEGKFNDNLLGNICIIIFAIFNVVFLIFYNPTFMNGFLIFAFVASLIYLITIVLLFFLPFKYLKSHMLADTLLFAFAILLPSAIVGASYVYYRPFREPFYIVMMVLGVVSLLFAFLLTMNPKLKHWEQLDRTINDNGEAVLMRPKYFVLAYTEWLLIFNFFFCEILLLIINLKA